MNSCEALFLSVFNTVQNNLKSYGLFYNWLIYISSNYMFKFRLAIINTFVMPAKILSGHPGVEGMGSVDSIISSTIWGKNNGEGLILTV